MDCCRRRKDKISPMRPPPIQSSPKQLKSNSSSHNLKVALQQYRDTHPNTLIVDSPSHGLERREMLSWSYEK